MVINELRKIYKISMQELADGISVSKQLIGKIEKGDRAISDDVLKKLVDFFGISKDIAADYRAFLTKDSLDEIEVLKIKKAKIEKETEEIEYEDIDLFTGETFMRKEYIYDVTGYIITNYDIKRKVLYRKIEDRLNNIIGNILEEQEKNNGFASIEQAVLNASDKVEFYEKLINLDAKVDSGIYMKIVRALTIVFDKGIDSDPFTRKLVKLITEEMSRKEKERQENIKMFKDIFGDKDLE